MNANNIKTQLFLLVKYDLRGHGRSDKVIFLFNNKLFLLFILLKSNLTKHYNYMDANIMKIRNFDKVKYDLKGHWRSYNTTFMLKSLLHIHL